MLEGSACLTAAKDYAEKGLTVLPLSAGDNKPLVNLGDINNQSQDDVEVLWERFPEAGVGIVTGGLAGIVVVELENKNGINGAESLKVLATQYGASSNKTLRTKTSYGGHLLYFRHPIGHQINNSVEKLGPGINIHSNGSFVIAPPTKSGGINYRWIDIDTTIAEMPQWMVDLCKDDPITPKTDQDIEVSEVIGCADSFKVDCRLRNDDSPYESPTKELLVREIDTHVLPSFIAEPIIILSREDSSPVYENNYDVMEELNAVHAVINLGGKCRILKQSTCVDLNIKMVDYSSVTDFKNFYMNRRVLSQSGKDISIAEYWLKNIDRRQYEGVVLAPGKNVPGYLNFWQGFTVRPIAGDCSLYIELIEEVIAGGDVNISRYILCWLANIIQNPMVRPGVAIVLKGDQGTGKGTLCKHFGEIIGHNYVHLTQAKHLLGSFNSHLEAALLIFADEAVLADLKKSEGVLKSLITDDRYFSENKGIRARQAKNHAHLIMASNNDWVVNSEIGDRRFFVVQVSDKRKRDREFFGALEHQMNHGGKEALLHYLMNYDLSGYDLGVFPNTRAVYEEKMNSFNPVQKFWFSRLQEGTLLSSESCWGTGMVSAKDFKNEFFRFCSEVGISRIQHESEFGKELRKLLPGKDDPKIRSSHSGIRTYSYQFPSLEVCRKYFSEIIKYDIPWPSYSDL